MRFAICTMIFYFAFLLCGWLVLGPYHPKVYVLCVCVVCVCACVNTSLRLYMHVYTCAFVCLHVCLPTWATCVSVHL